MTMKMRERERGIVQPKGTFDFENSTVASTDYAILLKQAPYYNFLFKGGKNPQRSISNENKKEKF